MESAVQIQQRYENLGPVGYLLGVNDFLTQKVRALNVSPSDFVKKDDTGDLVTQLDRCVHDSVINYFKAIGVPAAILGEEGQSNISNPKYAILLDEIEGTQNAVNGLDYGTNLAIARYDNYGIRVRDISGAVVTNLRKDTVFVGERSKGAYKIVNGLREDLVKKQTDVYELPHPRAYTTREDQIERQEIMLQIFNQNFGNQPRSVDATGTRLVELADGNIRAYGDWRQATKSWDVLPSALIVKEAGYRITDAFGFEFTDTVFYDPNNPDFREDGGLNRRIGENFIAASSEDHGLLVFGEGIHGYERGWTGDSMRDNSSIKCTWDYAMLDKIRLEREKPNDPRCPKVPEFMGYRERRIPLEIVKEKPILMKELLHSAVSGVLHDVITDRRNAYVGRFFEGIENLDEVRKRVNERYHKYIDKNFQGYFKAWLSDDLASYHLYEDRKN